MNKVTLILSILMLVAFALMMAPSLIALNRGKALRNIAIWLAVFTGLGLIYQNFGPGGAHELFSAPAVMQGIAKDASQNKTGDDKTDGSQGYMPPRD